jgi:hypothetical protein
MNSKIRQLEDDLVNILNASDVPIEVKRLVVGNVYHATEKAADNAILREKYEETMQNAPIEEKGDLTDAEGS